MSSLRLAGWLGLLGSILVGMAEFSLHFTPAGGVEDLTDYLYFNDISEQRLSRGHFLAIFSAPLYLFGYWFLSQYLKPAHERASQAFFCIGAYAFIIATVWIGQRFFIGSTVHAIHSGAPISPLLYRFAAHNEPLVNVLRAALPALSIIWIWLILTGKTHFPKWMAVFNPAILLAVIFGLYFAGTTIGLYLFPIAMNAAHFILFALALWTTR